MAAVSADPAPDRSFSSNLATPPPIPEAGRQAAMRLLERGLRFRYAETGEGALETVFLEEEFAANMGERY